MVKEKPIAELKINKKLYKMEKSNVKDVVRWLRKTATEISKNYGKYTIARFRYYS